MAKTNVLENMVCSYAAGLQKRGLYPAAVIAAGKSYYKKKGRSRPPSPHIVSDKLRASLATLGVMYSNVNGNLLGCCAEVDAADKILGKLRGIEPTQVEFSRARRPRTMQIVPPCNNCKSIFSV